MYKVGEYVIYKHYVCKINSILKNYIASNDYYDLTTVNDESLSIKVPTSNPTLLKPLMSKSEIESLLKKIPYIKTINIENERNVDNIYKQLISSNNKEDLIKIIKTAYLRNAERKEQGKKEAEKDTTYLDIAESILYGEISVVLNMTIKQTKEYVIKKVQEYDK